MRPSFLEHWPYFAISSCTFSDDMMLFSLGRLQWLLSLQVQEIPQQWFDDSEIIGPILHITCSPAIQLVEPATITIPTSLQADKNGCGEPSFESAHVRLLMNSDEETSHWTEITEQLPRPADLTNCVITFQATHFTR